MDAFNLSHFNACMYPCIIAKQGLFIQQRLTVDNFTSASVTNLVLHNTANSLINLRTFTYSYTSASGLCKLSHVQYNLKEINVKLLLH